MLGEVIGETDWDASYSSFSSAIDDDNDYATIGNDGLSDDSLPYSYRLLLTPLAPNNFFADTDGCEPDKSDILY